MVESKDRGWSNKYQEGNGWVGSARDLSLGTCYFAGQRAKAALTLLKSGRSFGVGVCSAYLITPSLPMTNAARADVSPTPARFGNTTSYALVVVLFRSDSNGTVIFELFAQASCAK